MIHERNTRGATRGRDFWCRWKTHVYRHAHTWKDARASPLWHPLFSAHNGTERVARTCKRDKEKLYCYSLAPLRERITHADRQCEYTRVKWTCTARDENINMKNSRHLIIRFSLQVPHFTSRADGRNHWNIVDIRGENISLSP